jgi:glycosyltransferase involved in cell wall biosynthesis
MGFFECLDELLVPAGTRRIRTKSSDLVRALNTAYEQATGAWVFLLGDDHEFAPDTLLRLLSHHLPAVVGLNISRHPPFGPMLLKGAIDAMPVQIDWADVPVGHGLWTLPPDIHTGNNALLVQRDVLDRIPRPLWRAGQIHPGILNEDFHFWHVLRKDLNIPVVVDLGAPIAHLNHFGVRPSQRNGQWTVAFTADTKPFLEMAPRAAQ